MRTEGIILNTIKATREEGGHLAWQCAQAIGVNAVTLSAWETGKKTPTLSQALRLAAYLGTSVTALYPHLAEVPQLTGWDTAKDAPTLEQLWRLAAALHVTPLALYPPLGELPDAPASPPAALPLLQGVAS